MTSNFQIQPIFILLVELNSAYRQKGTEGIREATNKYRGEDGKTNTLGGSSTVNQKMSPNNS